MEFVVPFGGLYFGMVGVAVATSATSSENPIAAILVFALFAAYAVWALILFARGTTPGKRALGMRVIREDGTPAGFFAMFVREWIGKWISGFVFGLGYLWILFDKDKQGWHDKLVSTFVIEGSPLPRAAGRATNAPAPRVGLTCPACGTLNPPGAKFCKQDGAKLELPQAAAADPLTSELQRDQARPDAIESRPLSALTPRETLESPSSEPPSGRLLPPALHRDEPSPSARATAPRSPAAARVGVIAAALAAAVLVIAGVGVFSYEKGWIGNRRAEVAQQLTTLLRAAGIGRVQVEVDDAWQAVASGEVGSPEQKQQVTALLASSPDIAGVVDNVGVVLDARSLYEAMQPIVTGVAGSDVTVSVSDDRVVTLTGTINDPSNRETLSAVLGSFGVPIRDQTRVSPAHVATQIVSDLRGAGIQDVVVSHANDGSIEILGTARSADERARAESIALARAGEAPFRNSVSVASAEPAQAPATRASFLPPVAAQPATVPPSGALAGFWIGDAKGTLLTYVVNFRLADARVGEVAGESLYGLNNKTICSGQLSVVEIRDSSIVMNDKITRVANPACNFGGTVTINLQDDGSIYAEWMSKSRAGKVAYKAVLRRR